MPWIEREGERKRLVQGLRTQDKDKGGRLEIFLDATDGYAIGSETALNVQKATPEMLLIPPSRSKFRESYSRPAAGQARWRRCLGLADGCSGRNPRLGPIAHVDMFPVVPSSVESPSVEAGNVPGPSVQNIAGHHIIPLDGERPPTPGLRGHLRPNLSLLSHNPARTKSLGPAEIYSRTDSIEGV